MSLLNNPLIDCSGEVLGVSGLTLSISDRMGLLEIGARVRICMPSAPENSSAGDICLLYTSDAADDLLCVDLGGRRII